MTDFPLPRDPVTVYMWVSGGTAVAGTDYALFGVQTVSLATAHQTATVTLNLLNAPLTSDKTIILSIATQHGPGFSGLAKLGTQLTHTVTIKASPPNAAPA